jgi:hypothetical protein
MDVGKNLYKRQIDSLLYYKPPQDFRLTIKQLESWLVLLDRDSRLSAIYTNPARIVRCYRAVSVGERKAMSGSTGHSADLLLLL